MALPWREAIGSPMRYSFDLNVGLQSGQLAKAPQMVSVPDLSLEMTF